MAALIEAPVVLVTSAHGAARSQCAVVKGFLEFDQPDGSLVKGIVLNQCGSESHGALLGDALGSAGFPEILLGTLTRGCLPSLASRHLGLVTADAEVLGDERLQGLADICEQRIDLDRLLALARAAPPLPAPAPAFPKPPRIRVGLARDEAFHFYYPDNLEGLERCGVQVVPFSPLDDPGLPPELYAVYIGGGYPEEHAAALAENAPIREAVRAFAGTGRPVYAECGGLMYLAQSLLTLDGRRHPMVGLLPFSTRMLPRRKVLGYAEATLDEGGLWGPVGTKLRGHEYHYSEIEEDGPIAGGWGAAYSLQRRRGGTGVAEGYSRGAVLASYFHVHFASNQSAVENFLRHCEGKRPEEL